MEVTCLQADQTAACSMALVNSRDHRQQIKQRHVEQTKQIFHQFPGLPRSIGVGERKKRKNEELTGEQTLALLSTNRLCVAQTPKKSILLIIVSLY